MSWDHSMDMIERWYRQYAGFLFKYVAMFIDYHSAQEIVQETFRIVCNMDSDELDEIKYPKYWLRKIAGNVLKNWKRDRDKWEGMLIDIDSLPDGALGSTSDEVNIEVEYAGAIKQEDLHLLKMLVSGYTYADAAQEFGISIEACRKRAKRAEARLEEKLKGIL